MKKDTCSYRGEQGSTCHSINKKSHNRYPSNNNKQCFRIFLQCLIFAVFVHCDDTIIRSDRILVVV
jgi:hypothetical protein